MASLGGSKSKSSTNPLTPTQVQGYYNQLNANTGGRLADFATTGTQPTAYQGIGAAGRVSAPRTTAAQAAYTPLNVGSMVSAPGSLTAARVGLNALTPEQVTAAGGLGALREQVARRQNAQTLAQYAADPSLTTFQRLRADQLQWQDFNSTLDALAAEREAAITGLLNDQQARQLQADLANQQATNQTGQFNVQAQQAYQQLLASLTGDEQARRLQAALANQQATNQTGQFNATQRAAAEQFNVGTALTEAQRQYAAQLANAGLSAADMEALARIYFGGAASESTSKSNAGMLSGITLSV